METLICHKRGAIKESQILGFVFGDKGELFACIKESDTQPIAPYNEDELEQLIQNGKLDLQDLRRFGGFEFFIPGRIEPRTDISKQYADFPALLFLVEDRQGNVKLRNAESFVRSLPVGVNFAAFIGNPRLRSGDAGSN